MLRSFVLLYLLCYSQIIVSQKKSLSVMTFNVENLFDTYHDKGKDDYTFLPLHQKQTSTHHQRCKFKKSFYHRKLCKNLDWNKAKLHHKMNALADSILQYNQQGPDILVLQEIENLQVLQQFNENFLKKARYQTVVLKESFDKRGIDVAILSRLPKYGEAKLHQISFSRKAYSSRPILEVHLTYHQKDITIFALHLPSQSRRHSKTIRHQAVKYLNQLASQEKDSSLIIAAGDFNVSASESNSIFRGLLGPFWYVSHLEGCQTCRGTYYYKKQDTWSFFDAILVFRESVDKRGWSINKSSIALVNALPQQSNKQQTPQRLQVKGGNAYGVSDHWPIAMKIDYTREL